MTHFSELLIPHARLELLESFQLYLSGSGLGLVILAILGACYSSSDTTTVIQSSVFRASVGTGETGPQWAVRPFMERCPCGLLFSLSSLLPFFLSENSFSPDTQRQCRWRSRQWRWNPQFWTKLSPPESYFPSPSAVLPPAYKHPRVPRERARSWSSELLWAQPLFLLERDNGAYFLGRVKQDNEENAPSFLPGA